MESFDDLGVAPQLVESLAREGIEVPTELQAAVVPVVRKGNNVLIAAGPGSGTLAAWAAGILERESAGPGPWCLVATATASAADQLAEATGRLAFTTEHSVAALGSTWALPAHAGIVFGTPEALKSALAAGDLPSESVSVLVVEQAQLIEATSGLQSIDELLDYVSAEAQRVVTALPVTDAVGDLVQRHARRAMTIPSPPDGESPKRGSIRFRIAPEPREAATLALVQELLEAGARHALVFCRSHDRGADVADYLSLHGFVAGAPGDADVPVWIGIDALEARSEVGDAADVVVISCDAPADADTLDRRHAISPNGVVVVLPRELAHLRDLGKRTGYDTVPFPPPPAGFDSVDAMRSEIERAMTDLDTTPYLVALEPLFDRHDPAEVAAAAVALYRTKAPAPVPPVKEATAGAAPAWAKLFVSVGDRDGLVAGDLLGAITGEANVSGDSVGRIDIKESHTVVEVHDSVAQKVIKAINGTTIRGRSVRADFDRPRKGGRRPR